MELRLVAKNVAALGIASVLSKAITAVVGILVTRYLGPGPFGDYSAAYAFAGTFVLFTDFGISQLMVQEGSRDESGLPVFLGNVLVFKVITSSIVYVLMLILMHPAGYNITIQRMVEVLGISTGLNALAGSVYNYYQTKQQMYLAAGYQFLTTLLIGVLTVVIIAWHGDVVQITYSHLAVAVVIGIMLYIAISRRMSLRVDLKALPQMLVRALPFGAAYIFYNIYFSIDSFMLSIMRTPTELGIYSAAYRLIAVLLFIPGIVTSVIYPVLFQLGVTDKAQHQKTIEKIVKVLGAVGIPGSVLLFVLAKPLIGWLYANRFPASAPIMMILTWFFALECLGFAIGDVLTTTNRQFLRTVIQGVAAIGNILLNLVLIPRMGIYGAAIATLITEVYIFAAYYFVVRKLVYKLHIWRQFLVVVGAVVVMAGVAYELRGLNPVVSSFLAGVVYLAIVIAFDSDFRQIGRYAWRQVLRLKA